MAHQPDSERAQSSDRADRRLDSWKEIAYFLNRDVRTVQRWEKEEGLPVHRHLHQNRSSVFGFVHELEEWLEDDSTARNAREDERTISNLKRLSFGLATGLVLVFLLLWLGPGSGDYTPPESVPFPQPVTGLPGHEVTPSLSPTGAQVAFCWNGPQEDNDDIYVQDISVGHPIRLTSSPSQEFSPAWSPKGDQIAFLRVRRSGRGQVVLINPVSRVERVVAETDLPPAECGPQIAWELGGESLIVAGRWKEGMPFSLASIELATGMITEVIQPEPQLFGDLSPSVSPTGDRLAFVRNVGPRLGEVYLLDRSAERGGAEAAPHQVTRLHTEIRGLSWVPSGEKIIFSGGAWPRATLWRVDPAGTTGSEPLVVAGVSAYDPAISQTRRLVFSRYSARRSLWKIDLEEPGSARPFLSPSASIGLPEYSTGWNRLVFTSDQSGCPELWYRDLQEKSAVRLTEFEAAHTGHASWSPDGRRVIFDSTVDGDTELFLIDIQAPAPQKPEDSLNNPWLRQLTKNSVEDVIPRWSRDGAWIYFSSNRSGHFEIWRLAASGGEPVQVTRGGGFSAIDCECGATLYYVKWNQEGIWKMPLPEGPEEMMLPGRFSAFSVAGGQLFFVEETTDGGHQYDLLAMDLETHKITSLFKDRARYGGSMAVSPDGRSVMLALYDEENADLMIVNGFHCRRLAGKDSGGMCANCAKELGGLASILSRLRFWSW